MTANAITNAIRTDATEPRSDLHFQTGGEGVRNHGDRGLYRFILTQKIFRKGGFDGLC